MGNKIKNRKIAIVGGAGFIGHNLAIKLKSLGANVSVIDSLQINNLKHIQDKPKEYPFPKLSKKIIHERLMLFRKNKIKMYILDARNYKKLCSCINKIKPQVIIHLAAVSHANKSNKDPHTTFDHSLRTLENTLDNAKNKIEHFIFLSSSMVYGNFKKQKVSENDRCEPIGIYGTLKYSAEKIIQAYGQIFNLPYTIIRPSALYGERCISRRVGQIFIENAINGKTINLHGSDKEKLDFTYIQDFINGIICALKSKNSINQIFNITYGRSRNIKTLLKILKDTFPNLKISYKKRDKFMPKRGTLDISKAKKLIKYRPAYPLEKAYPKYIEWYLKFMRPNN